MIQAIAHPTDFSPEGAIAFAHALRLALIYRCRLDLLHVRTPSDDDHWEDFPHVREVLARWGMLEAGASVTDIEKKLGVKVRKIEIRHRDPVAGLVEFMMRHRPDLVVVATHGRGGLNRWLSGSLSEDMARRTHLPTLFLGPNTQPFVDIADGQFNLKTVIIPVAERPSVGRALYTLNHIIAPFAPRLQFLHIGSEPPASILPDGTEIELVLRQGPVIETIVNTARELEANLIAMPTAGHNGFLDALRGSTTERVLYNTPYPLLACPA